MHKEHQRKALDAAHTRLRLTLQLQRLFIPSRLIKRYRLIIINGACAQASGSACMNGHDWTKLIEFSRLIPPPPHIFFFFIRSEVQAVSQGGDVRSAHSKKLSRSDVTSNISPNPRRVELDDPTVHLLQLSHMLTSPLSLVTAPCNEDAFNLAFHLNCARICDTFRKLDVVIGNVFTFRCLSVGLKLLKGAISLSKETSFFSIFQFLKHCLTVHDQRNQNKRQRMKLNGFVILQIWGFAS